MAIRPPAAATAAANINFFIFRFLCFCPEPPGAVPWLVQNHSTICLSGWKYRRNILACQRVRLKISEKSLPSFLPFPEGAGGRKPLSLLGLLGFSTPQTGAFRFFPPRRASGSLARLARPEPCASGGKRARRKYGEWLSSRTIPY